MCAVFFIQHCHHFSLVILHCTIYLSVLLLQGQTPGEKSSKAKEHNNVDEKHEVLIHLFRTFIEWGRKEHISSLRIVSLHENWVVQLHCIRSVVPKLFSQEDMTISVGLGGSLNGFYASYLTTVVRYMRGQQPVVSGPHVALATFLCSLSHDLRIKKYGKG